MLSLAAAADRWAPLFAIVIGASYSVQGTIGPAFIVGADLTHAQVAKQLSAFNLAFPAGPLLGAVAITVVQAAGWSTAAVVLTAVSWGA